MNEQTELTVWTVRNTQRGSDHYGACEICGKECSCHFVATARRIWVRNDEQHYLGTGNGSYGHMDCLIKQFGDLVSEDSLPRDVNILLFPQWAVDQLKEKYQRAVPNLLEEIIRDVSSNPALKDGACKE